MLVGRSIEQKRSRYHKLEQEQVGNYARVSTTELVWSCWLWMAVVASKLLSASLAACHQRVLNHLHIIHSDILQPAPFIPSTQIYRSWQIFVFFFFNCSSTSLQILPNSTCSIQEVFYLKKLQTTMIKWLPERRMLCQRTCVYWGQSVYVACVLNRRKTSCSEVQQGSNNHTANTANTWLHQA